MPVFFTCASPSILFDLSAMHDWQLPSAVEPEFETPQLSFDEDMLAQCSPVPKPDYPRWKYRKVPKISSIRDSLPFAIPHDGNSRLSKCSHSEQCSAPDPWKKAKGQGTSIHESSSSSAIPSGQSLIGHVVQ